MKDIIAPIIGIISITLLIMGLVLLGTDYSDFRFTHKEKVDNSIDCFQARRVQDHGKIIDLENANMRLEGQYQEIQIKYDELVRIVSGLSNEGAWVEKPAAPFNKNEFKEKIDGLQQ